MTRFDDVLAAIENTLILRIGTGALARITIVRDATGQATVVAPDDMINLVDRPGLTTQLHMKLGPYSAGNDRVLVCESELIDPDDVLASPDRIAHPDHHGIVVVDRLMSNQDWLRVPLQTAAPLALGVAYSIKGGVGRSTALAVLAWHFARLGKRVVVVDLDLAAPGIGSILLGTNELPDYGLVDWLVEVLVGRVAPEMLEESLAKSTVSDDAPGSVVVLPAFGAKTSEYVSKLGRIHLPSLDAEGRLTGIAHRLARLVSELARRSEPPEVVLFDARAGLDDMGAAAVTQLGAEVFLFARDDAQGWAAYRHLFDHLRLSNGIKYGMPEIDLRWRCKMVAAQLDTDEGAFARFLERSYQIWGPLYDDESANSEKTRADGDLPPQLFSRDESNAPHHPLPIYFNAGLKGLDLAHAGHRPSWPAIETAFGTFLGACTERLLGGESTTVDEEPVS